MTPTHVVIFWNAAHFHGCSVNFYSKEAAEAAAEDWRNSYAYYATVYPLK